MKYKVIGWTNYDNFNIPGYNKTIGFAEQNAIIEEIRKNKYLFSGWDHQESWENCVPILNDGKKRMFSQRGWGGVMAKAYGYEDKYAYSLFTFYGSIKSEAVKFPKKEFDEENYVFEPIENEHFHVDVCEGLFRIAQKKNPFYLEDLKELESIDKNDIITLHYQNESLTFLVKDINKNIKSENFKKHQLIGSKYKIIVTHKPFPKKIMVKRPILLSPEFKNEKFKECVKNYDFNTLFELLDTFEIDSVTKGSKSQKTLKTIKRFIKEYSEVNFEENLLIELLKYVDDFDLFKQIAYDYVKTNSFIMISFINFYLEKNIDVSKDILFAIKLIKTNSVYMQDILLKAIDLNPNDKKLRVKYYKTSKEVYGYVSFSLIAGLDLYDYLYKKHKFLIELNEYKKFNSREVLDFLYLYTYPKKEILKKENYPYFIPMIYRENNESVSKGILRYQEYVNEKFEIQNLLEDIILHGINYGYKNMKKYLNGEEKVANYVYALDYLTEYKYNLKEKTIEMCGKDNKNFVKQLESKYE